MKISLNGNFKEVPALQNLKTPILLVLLQLTVFMFTETIQLFKIEIGVPRLTTLILVILNPSVPELKSMKGTLGLKHRTVSTGQTLL